jgi:hypothetical protein
LPPLIAALPQTLVGQGIHGMPTLPIIGSSAPDWNRFSIFIYIEIFIASPPVMTYSCP